MVMTVGLFIVVIPTVPVMPQVSLFGLNVANWSQMRTMVLVYVPTFGWVFRANVGNYSSTMEHMGDQEQCGEPWIEISGGWNRFGTEMVSKQGTTARTNFKIRENRIGKITRVIKLSTLAIKSQSFRHNKKTHFFNSPVHMPSELPMFSGTL